MKYWPVYYLNFVTLIQVQELEKLGYSGFAIAFIGMDIQEVHTTDSVVYVIPARLDYFRSLIIAK